MGNVSSPDCIIIINVLWEYGKCEQTLLYINKDWFLWDWLTCVFQLWCDFIIKLFSIYWCPTTTCKIINNNYFKYSHSQRQYFWHFQLTLWNIHIDMNKGYWQDSVRIDKNVEKHISLDQQPVKLKSSLSIERNIRLFCENNNTSSTYITKW